MQRLGLRLAALHFLLALLVVSGAAPLCGQRLFDVPLRINMGGAETIDSHGRLWLGDGPGPGDPLNIRPNDLGGQNTIEGFAGPGIFQPASLDALGFDSTHPGDLYIFNSIRWDDTAIPGDFLLEIPLPQGEYKVNLYFNEGCCMGRHFQIQIQGQILDDDVSYLDYDPLNPSLGRPGVLGFEGVAVGDDELLKIGLLPCPACPNVTDTNPIINALEVISGSECDHLGLDFNCTYDAGTAAVTGTWSTIPGAEGFRILREGIRFGNDLPEAARSFTDPSPGSVGLEVAYTLQALDGGVPFSECICHVSLVECPGNLTCQTVPASGEVALAWTLAEGIDVTGYEVRRNGSLLETLPGSASTYDDVPTERVAEYSVTPLTNPPGACDAMACMVELEGNPFSIPLRINMGGVQTTDSKGRVWLGDMPGPQDALAIRPNDAGGTNWIESWCVPDATSLERLGLDPNSAANRYIFGTIRWDMADDDADGLRGEMQDINGGDTDFYLELPVPDGNYAVNLYAIECCCPQRHFKIEINGEMRDEDVSWTDYDAEPALGKVGRLGFQDALVTDGLLRITLRGCPDCPGGGDANPTIAALEVLSDPCEDADSAQCPWSFDCAFNPSTGQVTGSWQPPMCLSPSGYELWRDGVLLRTLPAGSLSFTDTLGARVAFYELRPIVPAGAKACPALSRVVLDPSVPFEVPLRINMGGPLAIDSKGRTWWGDGAGAGDALGIRVDDLGGSLTNTGSCPQYAMAYGDSMQALGFDPFDPTDLGLFNSMRWDVADDVPAGGIPGDTADNVDFRMEIPIPDGTYLVNLYFLECWGLGRHFKIELQGVVVDDDVDFTDYLLIGTLGRTGRMSFEGVAVTDGFLRIGLLPCFDCPFDPWPALDPNPMVSAIEVLPSAPPQVCPSGLACVADLDGSVICTWAPPRNLALSGYDLYRNGSRVATLPAAAAQFEEFPPCERALVYELVPLPEAACQGLRLRSVVYQYDCPFASPLRINMGALQMVDSRGTLWLGDGPDVNFPLGQSDPLQIRPDDLGGSNVIEYFSLPAFQPAALDALGFDSRHLGDVYIFNSIRWDPGAALPDFLLEIPIENGAYDVSMYVNEGCCLNRHFKVEMEGTLVADDVHSDLLGEVQRLTFEDVAVEDDILHIGLLPCAGCPGGGNIDVILNAIEILPQGSAKARFHRGDADQNEALELTDAIQVLGYLFLGSITKVPDCLDAADADDNGAVELTDAIRILSYLFLGTGEVAPPGPPPEPCGADPTDDEMDCQSYEC